jgi:serine/threonine-protein kinase RsbW
VGNSVLFSRVFDREAIGETRHALAGCAAEAGLAGSRLDAFVLAVNEMMTNAVRHGGGSGQVRLWRTAAGLACEISDAGPGAPPARLNGHRLPPTSSTGGRGLWLARHLCDTMGVATGHDGTIVHLTMAI